jgi:phosphopantothenoylcysteine synthetase/decarboxylase
MLTNKNIVLGVTGGIAVYKAADLASKLTQAGSKSGDNDQKFQGICNSPDF